MSSLPTDVLSDLSRPCNFCRNVTYIFNSLVQSP